MSSPPLPTHLDARSRISVFISSSLLLHHSQFYTTQTQAVVAQAAGAVGLVVINNEPGGMTFAMPGASDFEEDAGISRVNIPVAMVRAFPQGNLLLWSGV